MSLLNSSFIFIAQTTSTLIQIYIYVVIAACLISFVNPDPYNPIVRFLRNITEPAFVFIRRKLPFLQISGLDLSPILLIVFLQFVKTVLIPEIASFFMRF